MATCDRDADIRINSVQMAARTDHTVEEGKDRAGTVSDRAGRQGGRTGMKNIADMLPDNQADAIPAEQLCRLYGISKRRLHEAIRAERRSGAPILSSSETSRAGFWLWNGEDVSELRRYAKHVEGAALDMLMTLKPIRQLIKQHEEDESE